MATDSQRFVEISSLIVKLSGELEDLRNKQAEIQSEIRNVEEQLTPLVTEHTTLLSKFIPGMSPVATQLVTPQVVAAPVVEAAPVPVPAAPVAPIAAGLPPAQSPVFSNPLVSTDERKLAKQKLKQYLSRLDGEEGGIHSTKIAEDLHMDGVLVRELMRELSTGRP